MAVTTIGPVYDRINSVVTAQGYHQALEPFSFDLQPGQALDKAFYVVMAHTDLVPYLGGDRAEIHDLEVWITRLRSRNPHGVARQIRVDLNLIEDALHADRFTWNYCLLDDGIGSEVRLPDNDQAYHVVGVLRAQVDFERDMP